VNLDFAPFFMADPSSGRPKPSLFERVSARLIRAPEDRAQLIGLLRQAQERALLDADAATMIEGVLAFSQQTAADIMVPRAHMTTIDLNEPLQHIAALVMHTGHSRFPVIDNDPDHVLGLLHAKDLLRIYAGTAMSIRTLLRPATCVPESKPLNALLRELRQARTQMAIVVDEYGGVAGLVTLEDVLEQIVGEIEDEFDARRSPSQPLIQSIESPDTSPCWRVHALTPIDRFNAFFQTEFDESDVETVGGLLALRLGRLPRRGERIDIDSLWFEVLRAGPRAVSLLRVGLTAPASTIHPTVALATNPRP
jgi:Mg2+/Co2+ transporter CorC